MAVFLSYFIILIGKIIEVSLSTIRIVLISKGERKIGSILAFFEITLWITIVSTVLHNLSEDPIKALIYSVGFVIGNYIGSLLEDMIGIGTAQVQIIVAKEKSDEVLDAIYEAGFAYTKVDGKGRIHERSIIYTLVPRSLVKNLLMRIKTISDSTLISVHETKPFAGGYGLKKKRRPLKIWH